MFFTKEESTDDIEGNVDQYGDSYARDVSSDELIQASTLVLNPSTANV